MRDDRGYPLDEFTKDIGDIIDATTSKEELIDSLKEISETLKEASEED